MMKAQIVRIGKYFINIDNIAYVDVPPVEQIERTVIHVMFTSSDQKVTMKGEEAIELMNFLESIKE